MNINVNVKSDDQILPHYASEEAAGADIRANNEISIILNPGEFKMIPTGIFLSIPKGYEAQVRPRSGLAAKYGITVLNSPGTIDSDYRGEVKVILINHGTEAFEIKKGERIAQLVFASVVRAEFSLTDNLDKTTRGDGGFGSTGKA